jgi:predicted naringenin-chalcone synthase
MFFIGLGTAAPPQRYLQEECWEALKHSPWLDKLAPRSRAILRKVFLGNNGITSRHLGMASLEEAFQIHPDALHARFVRCAPELATEAARRALSDAGLVPGDIDAILISTCTGYLCPGLTSYVMERLGMERDVPAFDLVGQGCGAALPNLHLAQNLIAGGQSHRVLSICVEVCSAAFYLDDDPGVLISACLFGDGAAAAVLSNTPQPGRRAVEWKSFYTAHSPSDRDYLRFEQRGGMLRNILTQQVSSLAGKYVGLIFAEALQRTELRREDVHGWILHAGGRDILTALQERLGLAESDVQHSAAILREYGNVSSPSVLFVLEATLKAKHPGGAWWMSSFGAGFSCHGAMLEVGEEP